MAQALALILPSAIPAFSIELYDACVAGTKPARHDGDAFRAVYTVRFAGVV